MIAVLKPLNRLTRGVLRARASVCWVSSLPVADRWPDHLSVALMPMPADDLGDVLRRFGRCSLGHLGRDDLRRLNELFIGYVLAVISIEPFRFGQGHLRRILVHR